MYVPFICVRRGGGGLVVQYRHNIQFTRPGSLVQLQHHAERVLLGLANFTHIMWLVFLKLRGVGHMSDWLENVGFPYLVAYGMGCLFSTCIHCPWQMGDPRVFPIPEPAWGLLPHTITIRQSPLKAYKDQGSPALPLYIGLFAFSPP